MPIAAVGISRILLLAQVTSAPPAAPKPASSPPASGVAPATKAAPIPEALLPNARLLSPDAAEALLLIDALEKALHQRDANAASEALKKTIVLAAKMQKSVGAKLTGARGEAVYEVLRQLPDVSKAWPDSLAFVGNSLAHYAIVSSALTRIPEMRTEEPEHAEILKVAAGRLRVALRALQALGNTR